MAKYRAKEVGFIGDALVQKGDVFEFDGAPGKWMEPLEPVSPVAPVGAPVAEGDKGGKQAKASKTDA